MNNTTEVTREDFEAYEGIRETGLLNMYDAQVRELAGITREQHIYIINNYAELSAKYSQPEVK